MEAKLRFGSNDVKLAQSKGFNTRDIVRIIETVQEYRQQMMEAWNDYFG